MSTFVLELTLFMFLGAALLLAIGAYFAAQNKLAPLAVLGPMAGLIVMTALVVGYLALQKKSREVRAGWNLAEVVAATRDLSAGTLLTSDAVTLQKLPEQFVTPSIFTPAQRSKVVGRTLIAPLQRGQPISQLDVGIELAGCR